MLATITLIFHLQSDKLFKIKGTIYVNLKMLGIFNKRGRKKSMALEIEIDKKK